MLRRLLGKTLGMGLVVVQYGCIAHCTLEFVGDFVVCSGPSMEPTIHSSDVVLTEHISVNFQKVDRGDIVIARSPANPKQYICKRIAAMEGDVIESENKSAYSFKYVPRGHVWLEGDNKENSTDSRTYGPVPYALLRSRVCLKVWPVQEFGKLLKNNGSSKAMDS